MKTFDLICFLTNHTVLLLLTENFYTIWFGLSNYEHVSIWDLLDWYLLLQVVSEKQRTYMLTSSFKPWISGLNTIELPTRLYSLPISYASRYNLTSEAIICSCLLRLYFSAKKYSSIWNVWIVLELNGVTENELWLWSIYVS